MLKLRRIELAGFKSFSDKGEIVVNDSGVTAIVGPNGCGKSNVSDAIAWVLGEQSAKSLRGEKMEDVIFNGTRNRAPMGLAQVTITLTEIAPVQVPELESGHTSGNGNGNGNGNGHHGPPIAPRDVTVQRRLYRSGESVYLIDGKPCRLRDVHDIFMGTGLGPNSYAIIEQGRVGQLLSAKPSDRRALIEEAAGITKFKAKRKLAESRLEAARLNLSRINDILAEVDRQRNSLKRQSGKARRFIELRNRMRQILGAVFSTRAEMLIYQQESVETALGSIGGEGKRLETEIEQLTTLVRQRRADVEAQERTLEEMRSRRAEVELEHEKASQRIERLHDQIESLAQRKVTLVEENRRALEDLQVQVAEQQTKSAQQVELENSRIDVDRELNETKSRISQFAERRSAEERTIGELRTKQFDVVGREARIHNEIASRKEMIARIVAQTQGLEREEAEAELLGANLDRELQAARNEHSDQQTGFTEFKTRLQEAEAAHIEYKAEHTSALKLLTEARSREEAIRQRLKTIDELAVQRAYSTESVQHFFNHVRSLDWAPLGILADFVEVEPEYETLAEVFLKFELQYVVVQDRPQAERTLAVVKDVTKGRLNCLVLNGRSTPAVAEPIEGAIPFSSVLKFDDRVRHFSGQISHAYIVDTVERAWDLAGRYPQYSFVARTGEIVQGHVIGWGEHDALGPLSLKREIRDLDRKMDLGVRETAARENDVARVEDLIRENELLRARLLGEVRDLEKAILTMDHRVRTLSGDYDRTIHRARVARAEITRVGQERLEIESSLLKAETELTAIAALKAAIEQELQDHSRQSEELRIESENVRRDAAELQSRLAVLDERRSAITREIAVLKHRAGELDQRAKRAEEQIRQADEQQDQTQAMIRNLEETKYEMHREREQLEGTIAEAATRLDEARRQTRESETRWDEARGLLDSWKDRHNALEIEKTQIDSDLKHLSNACISELSETIEAVCLTYFYALPQEELESHENEYRDLREKIDAMGAVNMMAVEEYQEAEERFVFLNGQRQDLLDSIRDTTQAIGEIDSVCKRQFKEAFESINTQFKDAFVTLFGGGHGELRLIEETTEPDAGVEIVAQPPGKKLQNVLLLSGGEKALTALSLLIALFRFRPSPFCILDEVDAPLDEANVDRFAQMVKEMSRTTQFIVITHSKRTMETASSLYGVTMEEPGISKIVSVHLN